MTCGDNMRVLVIFTLGVLGCGLSDARIVSKCELKERLMQMIATLPEKVQAGLRENVVAKIVCHAEFGSGFNTSLVDEVRGGNGDSREHGEGNHGGSGHGGGHNGGKRRRRDAGEAGNVWSLYGLFQLSSPQVCSDGAVDSSNICNINCNNFIDDDITDDIKCVLKIVADLLENGFGSGNWKELKTIIRLVFQQDCQSVNAETYFQECH